ncbi:hypothetical protein [Listeria fleischmannii]|uniref:Lipoprotein n=1 Tax=Listeria fleischmannii FSL S10-1203 TaxID=1265822 RepID=W7DH69_9LIST|nr:hypothetical protein [Listeria fleischmannii]EUJ44703.1 hypothetical protein MCOL2_19796 [Listeria fleischmannii FSL S10-1203]
MKKWIGMSMAILVIVILSACGGQDEAKKAEADSEINKTDVKKASSYPEADQVAQNAFEAIVDWNAKEIYEDFSSKEYQKYLLSEESNDPNFSVLDRKMIAEKKESLNEGEYKKLIRSDDYFLAVYNQYKTKGVLDYILIGSTENGAPGEFGGLTEVYPDNTDLYVYKLELVKEGSDWKLNSYHSWPHFDEFDASDREARIQEMVKGNSKNITVLHRGKSFVTDSN